MKKTIYFALVLFTVNYYAQDIHWSQPTAALLYLNPAFTGITGKYSAGANFRDQWNPINKSYKTFAAMGDYCFTKEEEKTQVSGGAIIYKDNAGGGGYQVNAFALTLSCLLKINEQSRIGAGLGYSFVQGTINKEDYTWGNQFDGQNYNPGLSTGEGFSNLSKNYTDVNAGISYVYHEKSGTIADNSPDIFIAGYSLSHINRPQIGLNGSAEKLNMKHTVLFSGIASLDNTLALKPTFLFHLQGKMMNITAGTLLRFTLGQKSLYTGIKKGASFSAGLLYRFKDAVIPTMEFEKEKFAIGLSYDVTLSKLSRGNKYQGGLEIYLRLKAPNYVPKEKPVAKPVNSTRSF